MRVSHSCLETGHSHPLGATPDDHGVNFALFSQHATSVELLLFDEHDDLEPASIIPLDASINKTFHFWHVYVRGLKSGIHYAYRVDGPHTNEGNHQGPTISFKGIDNSIYYHLIPARQTVLR